MDSAGDRLDWAQESRIKSLELPGCFFLGEGEAESLFLVLEIAKIVLILQIKTLDFTLPFFIF